MSVAPAIGRYFVEIGEERILHRLHEAVTSGLTFDIGDYKESREHKLLHLVWRKEPRTNIPVDKSNSTTRKDYIQKNDDFSSEGKKKEGDDDAAASNSSRKILFCLQSRAVVR